MSAPIAGGGPWIAPGVAEKRGAYAGAGDGRSPEEILATLEQEMRDAAAQLDFERAALYRDRTEHKEGIPLSVGQDIVVQDAGEPRA